MKVVAFERSVQGTGASRRLRNSGKTPGIIYGGTELPQAVELDHNALFHALKKEAFHASILEIEVGGNVQQALLRDYQMHPFKPLVLHVDFQRVDAKQKIHVRVPLHFKGDEISPAVKLGGGVVNHVFNDLEISCLPADLPEFIEVDLSKIEVGHSIHAKDLVLPKGVVLSLHVEQDNPVVAVARVPSVSAEPLSSGAPEAPAAPTAIKVKDKEE
ncbi:MAG: 50S ribosomal protein L25/general stress protein Ctc [Betaproteobacteria bacterium]|jgi:large subunit ribosomal protein L25|nr:50S ribosomal protein L25/general stress protein Ctc [Polynucleobacter sp.]MCF8195848.1 50S ribosomal protein L25/general stress protein Ctc [Polynucleobacter sp.]NBY65367.1 50S ribosomal protein L25/general stress protein Ctc [Betaproteobacteria bacterium]